MYSETTFAGLISLATVQIFFNFNPKYANYQSVPLAGAVIKSGLGRLTCPNPLAVITEWLYTLENSSS